MKNYLLCLGILLCCCFASHAQITLTANPSSIASPGLVTVTASGETSSGSISVVGNVNGIFEYPTINTASGSVQGVINYYNPNVGTPTSFALNVSSPNSSQTSATYYINFTIKDWVHNTTSSSTLPVTVIINPTPVFYNDQESGTFTRNNCGAGYIGSSVTYTVAANTYTASTKAAANQLAINNVNANGQSYANSHGTCTVTCTDNFTGIKVDGTNATVISIGYHTLTVTTSGHPTNMVFINTTQGASITSQSFNASTGVGTCYFYADGYYPVKIQINLTTSCGTTVTTYANYTTP